MPCPADDVPGQRTAPGAADLDALAREVLQAADAAGLSLASAESCTGGLLSSLLTSVEGLSHSFECGFVVYSNEAKTAVLDVSKEALDKHSAVSREVVMQMAAGAVERSGADVAVAISGYTGPAGPHENGLVHFGIVTAEGRRIHLERHFGELEREEGQKIAAAAALRLLRTALLPEHSPLDA